MAEGLLCLRWGAILLICILYLCSPRIHGQRTCQAETTCQRRSASATSPCPGEPAFIGGR